MCLRLYTQLKLFDHPYSEAHILRQFRNTVDYEYLHPKPKVLTNVWDKYFLTSAHQMQQRPSKTLCGWVHLCTPAGGRSAGRPDEKICCPGHPAISKTRCACSLSAAWKKCQAPVTQVHRLNQFCSTFTQLSCLSSPWLVKKRDGHQM